MRPLGASGQGQAPCETWQKGTSPPIECTRTRVLVRERSFRIVVPRTLAGDGKYFWQRREFILMTSEINEETSVADPDDDGIGTWLPLLDVALVTGGAAPTAQLAESSDDDATHEEAGVRCKPDLERRPHRVMNARHVPQIRRWTMASCWQRSRL